MSEFRVLERNPSLRKTQVEPLWQRLTNTNIDMRMHVIRSVNFKTRARSQVARLNKESLSPLFIFRGFCLASGYSRFGCHLDALLEWYYRKHTDCVRLSLFVTCGKRFVDVPSVTHSDFFRNTAETFHPLESHVCPWLLHPITLSTRLISTTGSSLKPNIVHIALISCSWLFGRSHMRSNFKNRLCSIIE